jgi:hypothetical protein
MIVLCLFQVAKTLFSLVGTPKTTRGLRHCTCDFFRPHSWKQCLFTLLPLHSNITLPVSNLTVSNITQDFMIGIPYHMTAFVHYYWRQPQSKLTSLPGPVSSRLPYLSSLPAKTAGQVCRPSLTENFGPIESHNLSANRFRELTVNIPLVLLVKLSADHCIVYYVWYKKVCRYNFKIPVIYYPTIVR